MDAPLDLRVRGRFWHPPTGTALAIGARFGLNLASQSEGSSGTFALGTGFATSDRRAARKVALSWAPRARTPPNGPILL